MNTATARQLEILDFLTRQITAGGAPTLEETAQAFDIHVNAARKHVQALAAKGLIERLAGQARGIRLPAAGVRNEAWGVPLVGRVAAGSPIMSEGNIEAVLALDSQLFWPRPHFLLRVVGHSMIDAGIAHDDLIAVHRTALAEPGQIVVARLDGEITVKRLAREGDDWLLLPANPDFVPIRVSSGRADFAIEGRHVGTIRRG